MVARVLPWHISCLSKWSEGCNKVPSPTIPKGIPLRIILALGLCLGFFASGVPAAAADQTLEEFLSEFQRTLEAKEFDSYLSFFAPEIREKERAIQNDFFDAFSMDTVKLARVQQPQETGPSVQVGFQALYQNEYSGMFEIWLLDVVRAESGWQVAGKTTTSALENLYKVRIPSDRVERAASVEIDHVDIKVAFEDALVFYDNIPHLDTALVVIGRGRVQFTPSDPIEKHQLELFYKKDAILDKLDFLFLRCSNQFFQNQVRIRPAEGQAARPVLAGEREKAAALFMRYYPRSFTIENSMTGELFSFLPQGDEAVLEMKGSRVGGLTYIYSPFGEDEVNVYASDEDRIISLYSPPETGDKKRMFISFGERYDVVRTQIEVELKPRSFFLSARARVEIVPLIDHLDVLKLTLNPELQILKICDEAGRELFYTQDRLRKILYIYFIVPPPKDVPAAVTVVYRGRLVPPQQTVDVVSGRQISDAIILGPVSFDSVLYSQSAFWYPAAPKEDFFQASLKIIVPHGYKCVANGEFVEKGELKGMERVEELDDVGSGVYRFVTKSPVKYLAFITGRFEKGPQACAALPIRVLVSPEVRDYQNEDFAAAQDILAFFESRFGPFPFEKLGIVHRIWPAAGGHSPASFVVLNEIPRIGNRGMYINVDSPVDLSRWKEYFLAHEIAHQWWGQNVTWGSYRDLWLGEGMAQFGAILYLRNKYGESAYTAILKKLSQWTERKSVFGPILLGSRLSLLDFEAYQAIIYDKAALIMNMLLDLCGEDVLCGALREFQEIYHARTARTRDFQKILEKRSGRDLSRFFDKWFSSHALPEVRVSQQIMTGPAGSEHQVVVRQLREVFVFPLWLEWKEGGRTRTEMVVVDQAAQTFSFPFSGKPGKVVVNPRKAVPGNFSD
jgi:hypothetical protein